jgi:photosystem II stability/assembly factor-like uncharacterized protein
MQIARAKWLLVTVSIAVVGCGEDDEKPSPSDGGKKPPSGWLAAVGARGTLAQTFDDQVWETRTIAADDLLTVTCVGNELGWVAGVGGTVLHTSDAGVTWVGQDAGPATTWHSLAFAADPSTGSLVGVVAGDGGALAVTRDGGASYRRVDSGTAAALRSAAITEDSGLLLVGGDGGVVLRSVDLGESFTRASLSEPVDVRAVAIGGGGLVVIAADAAGGLWLSTDRGTHFAREHRANVSLESVSLSHSGAWGLAAGNGGATFVRDGLGRWTASSIGATPALHASMISHDDRRFYLAGDDGALFRSGDRGGSWTKVALDTDVTLSGLEDLDPH